MIVFAGVTVVFTIAFIPYSFLKKVSKASGVAVMPDLRKAKMSPLAHTV
jgi:hypothetical protein